MATKYFNNVDIIHDITDTYAFHSNVTLCYLSSAKPIKVYYRA